MFMIFCHVSYIEQHTVFVTFHKVMLVGAHWLEINYENTKKSD